MKNLIKRYALIWKSALLLALLQIASCAKFPAIGSSQDIHLIFTMTVAGHIQDGTGQDPGPYVYIVAIYPSTDLNPTVVGPEPVVAPPWGNGFVAGNATAFIRYGLDQALPYTVYLFSDPSLNAYGATGVPISSLNPNGTATIQFEVDIAQLEPSNFDVTTLQSVLVNFLTMDKAPTGSYSGQKYWDALGDSQSVGSINDYVRIPLTYSFTYDNNYFSQLEPAGDVSPSDVPNLDIVNFSVQVVKP